LHDVSIAMATYNGARFMRVQLESIAAQTLRPAELVVCDDGSSDDTVAILEDFASTATFPVHVVRNEVRLGSGDNFLRAVSLCKSSFVSLCDQDDVWLPSKLSESVHRLVKDDSLICLHTATITDQELKPTGVLRQRISSDAVLPALSFFPFPGLGWGMTMTFRRSLIDLLEPSLRPSSPWTPGKLAHDIWIHLLAASLGSISHIDQQLILYRQHDSNSCGTHNMTAAQRLVSALTVPMHRHRGRARFYREVRDCFRLIAASNIRWSKEASSAAVVYDRMRIIAEDRVRSYIAPRALERLGGLIACHWAGPLQLPSLAKDFTFGVLRLGRYQNA
jgi:glycosyltransferase involved in cell wall biosynthesis